MNFSNKTSVYIRSTLVCPRCKLKLSSRSNYYVCKNEACKEKYPVVNGTPILINEENSLFEVQDFIKGNSTTIENKSNSGILKKLLSKFVPRISANIKGDLNFKKFIKLIQSNNEVKNVLVIGGESTGQGMKQFNGIGGINLVETDVSMGSRTMLVCDCHDIPFSDNTFDGIIIQAVLEHVVDPYRCVEEIHRVLKSDGVVYSETPFMQQVHMGRYDFTRFTHLGHRRLFRKFSEIDSGAVCGPGMALAWSFQYFLLSFTKSKKMRTVVILFSSVLCFFWKYFDYYLVNKKCALDSASGFYFLGKKSKKILTDKELIRGYKGCVK